MKDTGDMADTKKMKPKKRLLSNIYFIYTLVFAVTACAVFGFFLVQGKAMIWNLDGIYQHYNAFVYLGQWVRRIITVLFTQHKLIIPMWEWSIGYGADIVTTLSYYNFGDPFALISVFFPTSMGEIGYTVSILLRFYAAGLSFCAYCSYMKCQKWSAVCGSLMYVFCAYSIFAGVRHPYFMNPMIYLPLIFIGVERILNKKSPMLYILSIFISAVSNFYFFYILVILTVLYAAVRTLSNKENRNWKTVGCYFISYLGYAVIGVAMAMVILLPTIMGFMGNARVNSVYEHSLFYSSTDYEKLLGSAVGVNSAMLWAYIGMGSIAYIGLGISFMRYKHNKWELLYFAFQILFLLFPLAGSIFNGFGYVTNRWVFSWSFIVAFIFAKNYPYILEMNTKERFKLCLGGIAYAAACILLESYGTKQVMVGCLLLLICLILMCNNEYLERKSIFSIPIRRFRLSQLLTLFLTFCCIFEFVYSKYSPNEGNYLSEFISQGTADGILNNESSSTWNLIDDESFYRIDSSTNDSSQHNYSLSTGQSTTTEYWSIVNADVYDFLSENSAYNKKSYFFTGLQSRAYLDVLTGCKYFVANASEKTQTSVPYGYGRRGNAVGYSSKYYLYENDYALPLGFTYDAVIKKSDYEKMSFAQRQQAMLQGAVIADDSVGDMKEAEPVYNDSKISYTLRCDDNCSYDGHTLKVTKDNAQVTLTLSGAANGEVYLQLLGMNFKSSDNTDDSDDDDESTNTRTNITAACGNAEGNAWYYTSKDKYAVGRNNFLINTGYSSGTRQTMTVTFQKSGTYTFNDLSVVLQPMDNLNSQVSVLKQETLQNVVMEDNHISGTITVSSKKLLCLSVPYSDGWSLYVDGKKTNIIKTDLMFCGVYLDSGSHTIEMRYSTPYIKVGCVISAVGVLAAVWIGIREKKKNDQMKEEAEHLFDK